jgi:hypothetical protein
LKERRSRGWPISDDSVQGCPNALTPGWGELRIKTGGRTMAGREQKIRPEVFVASASEDGLEPYRMAAQKAVLRIDFHPNMMEYKPPTGVRPAFPECMARVDDCQALIVFVGRRYGWEPADQPPPGGKSITWLECQRAADSGKEVLAYFVQTTEGDADDGEKQGAFRAWLDAHATWVPVTDALTCEAMVAEALHAWLERNRDWDFSKRVSELSAPEAATRIAAIQRLSDIADAFGARRAAVLNELAVFVRARAPWQPGLERTNTEDDVREAMSTIARIPKADEHNRITSVDLHNVDLPHLRLERGDLRGATLWGSNLRDCVLYRADLREADLGGVDFTGASLELADLRGALLFWSNICAPIRPCILRRTRLAGAKLEGADLEGADLREALDLRPEQLRQAILNEHTLLPPGLQR